MSKAPRRIAIFAASIAALAAVPPSISILSDSYCSISARARQNVLHFVRRFDKHWMPICHDAIDNEYLEGHEDLHHDH